jgi:hypothetical protein
MWFYGQSKRKGALYFVFVPLEKNYITLQGASNLCLQASHFSAKLLSFFNLHRADSFSNQLNHQDVIAWLTNYPQIKSDELAARTL